jgi:thiol-disulfide isomerase/thioredoxin
LAVRFDLRLLLFAAAIAGCDAAPSSPPIVTPKTAAAPAALDALPFGEDFAAALERAKAEGKPLLIFFETAWCPYCRQLQNEVLARPEFRAAAERFVCVRVDGDREPRRAVEYRIKAFPTIVVAAPDGTAIERIVGILPLEAITTRLGTAAALVVAALGDPTPDGVRR